VISGASCASEAVIQAAANVAMAAQAALSFTVPECNTVGAALIGGRPLSAAFQAVRDGHADTVIILENDLYRRAPAAEVDAFLKTAAHVIVLDHLDNPTTEKSRTGSPGRNLRRIRRHFRQQRRTRPAILPGIRSAE
jgi:NADH-quinone oxidoreductase subunit G